MNVFCNVSSDVSARLIRVCGWSPVHVMPVNNLAGVESWRSVRSLFVGPALLESQRRGMPSFAYVVNRIASV